MNGDDLRQWIIDTVPHDVTVEMGPALPDVAGRFIVLTRYGGGGYVMDQMADNRSWQVRTVGEQNDYGSAESLADLVDQSLTFAWPDSLGGTKIISVNRIGGPPSVLLRDNALRTHFVCSYSLQVESVVPTGA